VLYDKILKVDAAGAVLWSWDTYDYLPLSWADPYNDTIGSGNNIALDFAHCNAIQWDYDRNVFFLNSRHLDTFWKINMTSSAIIWGCGLHGNFTLRDGGNRTVSSLWYGCHDLHEISPDRFMMFDNDFHNLTNVNDTTSRILEVTLNERTMVCQETWSWAAPTEYYSPYWGEADLLSNGDRIGTFGTQTKQFNSTVGAVIVEVNQTGQVVRTWIFPAGWGIYRALPTTDNPIIPSFVTILMISVIVASSVLLISVILQIAKKSSAKKPSRKGT
jgi:hypothetical protein